MVDSTAEIPPVAAALRAMSIPHRVFRHSGPVNSLAQAASERGQTPDQIIRSILFRVGKDAYMMALIAGPAQVAWRKLRTHLDQSRLTMATPDEVAAVTGYTVGAVGPFGLARDTPILVDRAVLAQQEISLGSGVRGVAVILSTQSLMAALGEVEVIDLRVET